MSVLLSSRGKAIVDTCGVGFGEQLVSLSERFSCGSQRLSNGSGEVETVRDGMEWGTGSKSSLSSFDGPGN
jgi:hypothetical protein